MPLLLVDRLCHLVVSHFVRARDWRRQFFFLSSFGAGAICAGRAERPPLPVQRVRGVEAVPSEGPARVLPRELPVSFRAQVSLCVCVCIYTLHTCLYAFARTTAAVVFGACLFQVAHCRPCLRGDGFLPVCCGTGGSHSVGRLKVLRLMLCRMQMWFRRRRPAVRRVDPAVSLRCFFLPVVCRSSYEHEWVGIPHTSGLAYRGTSQACRVQNRGCPPPPPLAAAALVFFLFVCLQHHQCNTGRHFLLSLLVSFSVPVLDIYMYRNNLFRRTASDVRGQFQMLLRDAGLIPRDREQLAELNRHSE